MKVVKPGLSAIVTKKEYDERVGFDYPSLYVVDDNFTYYKRAKLDEGGHCLLRVKELPKVTETEISVQEEISFLPGGKVPFVFLNQIASFFFQVMDKNFGGANSRVGDRHEAMAHILWDKVDKKYIVGIPTQRVSAARVDHNFDDRDPSRHVVVIDIHSHNTMGSFFSGVDDADDKKGVWFSGVVGGLDKPVPSVTAWRFSYFGDFRKITMEDIFEGVGPVCKTAEFPAEWMDKVVGKIEYKPSTVTYTSGRSTGGSNVLPYNAAGLYGSQKRPDYPSRKELEDTQAEDEDFGWAEAFRSYEKTKKSKNWGADEEYLTRAIMDIKEGIEDLTFPIYSDLLLLVAEALKEQVSAGISRLHKKNGGFYLRLAEVFLEAFSEEHEGEVGRNSSAAHLIECILSNGDWSVVTSNFETLMEKVVMEYEEGEDVNMVLDYLEGEDIILSVEHIHRLGEISKNAQVRSDETGN